MGSTTTGEDLERREFWLELCPGMSIEGSGLAPRAEVGDKPPLLSKLKREGYIQVPGALPEACIAPIRTAISTLYTHGVPLAFAFVYDEPWLAFQGLSTFLSTVLGQDYRALPDFWVWHVNPSDEATGWGPHRDKANVLTLDDDNSPHTLTVWLPLTNATTLNSCMYVLPAHLDQQISQRSWNGPNNTFVQNLQDVRALPATAGSVLAWNQAILHWGSRASDLGEGPRISAALEFQRGDRSPFNRPLLDPGRAPSFTERLGLVGKQILQYRHMYPLTPEAQAVAASLHERFMPVAALV
jgi:hypothetical protein